VGPHPKLVVDSPALFVEAAVEDVGGQLLGVACHAHDLVEVALVMAVEAGCRDGGKGIERVAA
jgi:hypothetical protein